MKVAIYHPSTRNNQYSQLDADYANGVNSVTIKNTDGFLTTKYVVIGTIGFEQSEVVLPTTVTSPDTLVLSGNTKFPHNEDTKVTVLDYNQIKIYRSITGITGSYAQLGSPIDIMIDADFTTYEDTSAQPTYYYKYAYFNAATSAQGDLSDPIAATGFLFYSSKTMIDRVLSLFGDMNGDLVTRSEVLDYLNEWYETAQKRHALATKRLNIKTFSFTVQQNIDQYDSVIPADFLMEKAVRVSRDNGVTFPYKATMIGVDSLGTVYQTNVVYGYGFYGSSMILDRLPVNSTDVIKVYYVPVPVTFTYQTDVLIQPFQNSSNIFVRGALSMCYLKDRKFDEYKALDTKAGAMLDEFISFVKRMQSLHPQFSEIMDESMI